jgi:hypothetical protein
MVADVREGLQETVAYLTYDVITRKGTATRRRVRLTVLRDVRKRLQVLVLRARLDNPGEVGRQPVKLSGTCRRAAGRRGGGGGGQLAAVWLC